MLICGKYSHYVLIYLTDMSRLPDTYISSSVFTTLHLNSSVCAQVLKVLLFKLLLYYYKFACGTKEFKIA